MGCAGSADLNLSPAGAPRFFDRYELAEFIGQGSFGEVRAARLHAPEPHSAHGTDLAVKMVVFDSVSCDELQRVNRERAVWQKLGRHPNIVALRACFLDTYQSKHCAFFVMERCLGNLRDRRPQQHELKGVLLDVMEAVAHVHSCGIVHRDIKMSNLLWSYITVKLCDFGTAHELDDNEVLTSTAGTAPYMSPEVASCSSYGYPTDIWSSGVVVYCLLYNKFPFVPAGGRMDRNGFKRALLHGPEPEFAPCATGNDVEQLCREMLIHKACDRPTAASALQHLRPHMSRAKEVKPCELSETAAADGGALPTEHGKLAATEDVKLPKLSETAAADCGALLMEHAIDIEVPIL